LISKPAFTVSVVLFGIGAFAGIGALFLTAISYDPSTANTLWIGCTLAFGVSSFIGVMQPVHKALSYED